MTDNTMTEADQAFYAWLHSLTTATRYHPLSLLQEVFMAGWTAHMESAGNGQ